MWPVVVRFVDWNRSIFSKEENTAIRVAEHSSHRHS